MDSGNAHAMYGSCIRVGNAFRGSCSHIAHTILNRRGHRAEKIGMPTLRISIYDWFGLPRVARSGFDSRLRYRFSFAIPLEMSIEPNQS
jgi:hypothetical protein